MFEIIAGQTANIPYVAEQRDGSGVIASGTDCKVKIHDLTAGKWWSGTAWADTSTALTMTAEEEGAFYYAFACGEDRSGHILSLTRYHADCVVQQDIVEVQAAAVVQVGGSVVASNMRGTDGAYTGTPPTASAIGTDAASKILATPANKLATDASGRVSVDLSDLATSDALEAVQAHGDETWATADVSDLALEETAQDILTAVGEIVPAGACDVTLACLDDQDTPAPVGGVSISIYNEGGQRIRLLSSSLSTGQAVTPLDAGNYTAVLATLAGYVPANPYAFTVGDGATQTVTLALAKVALPAPASDPGMCNLYADMSLIDGGAPVGAGEGSLRILKIIARPAGVTRVFGESGDSAETDATGRVVLPVARGCKVQVSATWPVDRVKNVTLTVPDAAEYDLGAVLQD